MSGAYIGKSSRVTYYEWINITASNISQYFTITDGSYKFARSGSTMTSNNAGVHSSTAQTTLKPIDGIDGFSFDWSVSSESNYDKFYVTYGSSSNPANIIEPQSGTQSGSYIKEAWMSTSRYLIFYYTKDSSSNSGNDKAVISNFKIRLETGTGYKDVARKVTNIFIGVNNVARRVKKAYIGVNGIARLFYAIPRLERGDYIALTTGNSSSYGLTAANNSTYAVFNDGVASSSLYYLINSSGTATNATQTTYAFMGMTGAGNSNYAYFMGGENSGGTVQKGGVRVNTSGTRTTTSFGSGIARKYFYSFGTGCNSNTFDNIYAVFAGGNNGDTNIKYLDYVNTSNTWSYTTLSVTTYDAAVASNSTYCFIAGGASARADGYSGYSSTVNTLNKSGTRSTTTALSTALISASGANAGNLAIIGGGRSSSQDAATVVNAYNTSGTRTILSSMPYGRAWTSCASGGNYAIFIGDLSGEEDPLTWYADVYDSSGTLMFTADDDAIGYCLGISTAANMVGNRVFYIDNHDFLKYDEYDVRQIVVNY